MEIPVVLTPNQHFKVTVLKEYVFLFYATKVVFILRNQVVTQLMVSKPC